MTPNQESHIEECSRVFVQWKWFTSALLGILISIITIAAVSASTVSKVDERTISNREHINRLEGRVDKKLDRIMDMLEKH